MGETTPPPHDLSFAFIRDEAADEDFFGGSHSRVATAIASVIRANADLKVIGLLGPWGSGKSTVVKLLQSELKKDDGTTTYCFSYDAWLHQSDPPRRSFLETLIHFLIDHKLTSLEKWQDRIDQLNRQIEDTETISTPTLTTSGRLIVLSLFLLPLGMQFVSHDWYQAAFGEKPSHAALLVLSFGIICLLLPALIAAGVYLFWRPIKLPWSRRFWRGVNWISHRPPHEQESILSLFMNKEVQKLRNRVTRAPDPTTIEFQDTFREIMDAVNASKRRFLFVIDNLDRLPETEAVAMWGTIRSFFLGAREATHVRRTTRLPTVILPIDEDAVRRMYAVSHGSDADGLAKSFMDKTFDLTFRVTRPVLTDWNAYLERQMRVVFGPQIPIEWPYITGRLYEKLSASLNSPSVTPRMINALVNSIALLWLQWKDSGVSFPAIAYYSIFREAIDANILTAVTMPTAGIDQLDTDWRRGIAALHYGVKPSDAAQILIEQPLRNAISDNDSDRFKELSSMPSFDRVLLRIVDQLAAVDGVDPSPVFRCSLLLGTLPPSAEVWITHAWQMLRVALQRTSAWRTFGEEEANSVGAFLSRCNAVELPIFVRILDQKLKGIGEAVLATPLFPGSFITAWETVLKSCKINNVELPIIHVPGSAAVFLSVAAACIENIELLGQLRTDVQDTNLVEELAANLQNAELAPLVEARFKVLYALDREVQWTSLIDAAAELVRNQNTDDPGMDVALLCLGLLRTKENYAEEQIKSLFDDGQLASRLNEAYKEKNNNIIARSFALLILTGSEFSLPSGGDWAARFSDQPNLVHLMNAALVEFDSPDNFQELIRTAAANQNLISIVRAIVSFRVKEGAMGRLHVAPIIADLPQYLDCVTTDLQDSFIQKFSRYKTFWDKLKSHPFDENVIAILYSLIRQRGDVALTAQKFLSERLEEVTPEIWISAIRDEHEPLMIASTLAQVAKFPLHVGLPLFEALQGMLNDLLAEPEDKFRARWFLAATYLSPNAKHTLLSNVRDQINSGAQISSLVGLLSAGGIDFLSAGGFSDKPDESVRHIILPLLSDAEGIAWLLKQSDQTKPWVEHSKTPTKDFLTECLRELWMAGDDEGKEPLRSLQMVWGLLPIAVDPMQS